MTEPRENIGRIHGSCSDERLKQTQLLIKNIPAEQFIGKYVKIAFKSKGLVEHMWLKVTDFACQSDYDLVGTLDNDPVIVVEFKCGDQVEFKLSEIEQVA